MNSHLSPRMSSTFYNPSTFQGPLKTIWWAYFFRPFLPLLLSQAKVFSFSLFPVATSLTTSAVMYTTFGWSSLEGTETKLAIEKWFPGYAILGFRDGTCRLPWLQSLRDLSSSRNRKPENTPYFRWGEILQYLMLNFSGLSTCTILLPFFSFRLLDNLKTVTQKFHDTGVWSWCVAWQIAKRVLHQSWQK